MLNEQKTIERIAVFALAEFLVRYFVYQVAYGTNESSYRYGYKWGRASYNCANYEADCDNGLDTCTVGGDVTMVLSVAGKSGAIKTCHYALNTSSKVYVASA